MFTTPPTKEMNNRNRKKNVIISIPLERKKKGTNVCVNYHIYYISVWMLVC